MQVARSSYTNDVRGRADSDALKLRHVNVYELRNHYPVPHNNAVWLEDRRDWSILTKKCERMSIRDWMV